MNLEHALNQNLSPYQMHRQRREGQELRVAWSLDELLDASADAPATARAARSALE